MQHMTTTRGTAGRRRRNNAAIPAPEPIPPSSFDAVLRLLHDAHPRLRIVTARPDALPSTATAHPDLVHDTGADPDDAFIRCRELAACGFQPLWLTDPGALSRGLAGLRVLTVLPVTVALEGASPHDLALLRTLPGATVAEPSDASELDGMLRAALAVGRTCVIRLTTPATCESTASPPPPAPHAPHSSTPLDAPYAAHLLREGTGPALIALGAAVPRALAAADLLARKGLHPRVLSARCLQPLDRDALITTALSCAHLVTVEEGDATAGFGAAVLELLADAGLRDGTLRMLGAGADADTIARAALSPTGGGDRSVVESLGPWPHAQRDPRVPTSIPVRISIDDVPGEALARNLSEGGMFIEMLSPPSTGTRLAVTFSPKELFGRIEAEAEVVWCRAEDEGTAGRRAGVGVRFTRLDLRSRDLIRDFVTLVRSKLALSPAGHADEHAPAPLHVVDMDDVGGVILAGEAELAATFQTWVDGFRDVTGREDFLWRWCYKGVLLTSLTGVEARHARATHAAKLLALLFDVLLEDAADPGRAGNPDLRLGPGFIDALLDVPFRPRERVRLAGLGAHEIDYLAFVIEVWDALRDRIALLPRYGDLAEQFVFDVHQLVNRVRFLHHVRRRPSALNADEHAVYVPHRMHLMLSGTLDLMAFPDFDVNLTGRLREVLFAAQKMGYAADALSSWEAQVRRGDFLNPVVARALACGAVAREDLTAERAGDVVQRIRERGVASSLLADWTRERARVRERGEGLPCVDVGALLGGLEALVRIHLGIRD